MYTHARINTSLHQKIKEEAIKKNKTIVEMYEEIINFYFYRTENELDHRLERYLFDQFQKLDKHLSSILIKNAKDTCTDVMGTIQILKLLANGKMTDDEIRKELERLGIIYFNDSWRKKES